ncbi:hypothetical protein [Saccharibacillus qingshengii]|uniref:hypothetical protein n=1 Tax=Saccharibacillus qingshengii TaxID=1763540 RepID=UPI0015558D3C|nr:hypothetical protein [Saccharibacillus qingshengii]
MPITPIDTTRKASRIAPVQPVQRSQAAGLRFKLPGTDPFSRKAQPHRKSSYNRSITVHEDGWIRQYGILPDGTRILLSEEREHERHTLPLPHADMRIAAAVAQPAPQHDPESSIKSSAEKLQALLDN